MYYLLQFAALLTPGNGEGQVNVPTLSDAEILTNVLNIVYFLAGVIAVIIIIIAGITYATSAGNSAGVTKAKNLILYSVVGLILITVAFSITNFVVGRF